jgi:TM2 domain-containing membrane protein YozV
MKNKTTAGLLALLLGGLGAHKFYLGKWVWGLVYLIFCFTFIPAVISLIEAIIFFSMKEAEFQLKYGDPGYAITSDGIATPETHVRCPDCRELVRKDARKCKHCGTALIPQT